MVTQQKLLIIVEGPAGSGKSTFIEALHTRTGVQTVSASLPRRTYTGNLEPAELSAINDYTKLIHAISSEDPIVLIDRLGSQRVYGELRRKADNDVQLKFPSCDDIAVRLGQLIYLATEEVSWRNHRKLTVAVVFLFFLPEPETLTQRRLLTPHREYHWPEKDELAEYQDFFTAMFLAPYFTVMERVEPATPHDRDEQFEDLVSMIEAKGDKDVEF